MSHEAAVPPETRYARLGGDRIAYRVLGQGPPDLVMTTGGFSQIDIIWEAPGSSCSSVPWRRSQM